MTTAFLGFSDGLIRSENLGPATGEELKATMERFLALSKKAVTNSNDGESSPVDSEMEMSRSPPEENQFNPSPDQFNGTEFYSGIGVGPAVTKAPKTSVPEIRQ